VPGLRREEVASLAGVSVEYYKRLERGSATGASDSVLDAIADALQLDDAERTHLFDLARAATPTPARLYAPLFDSRELPPNSARFTFLDPAAQEFFVDWEKAAMDLVANLRSQAGRNPYDRELSDLVGELSTRSEPFRKWWAAHNVRYHQTGTKRLRHPVVGELGLSYEVMELTADRGLRLAVFRAEPGSRSQQALDLLASWTATPQPESAAGETPRP
jgi:transcriptional regulator with XRE-family HTH domain